MSAAQSRRGLVWAIAGAVVLLLAVVAMIISSLAGKPDSHTSTPPVASPSTPGTIAPPSGSVVDASVSRFGWLPEPITTNRDAYIRAALAAASTFDPSKSTRDNFLAYLATWFTPDTRWTHAEDRANATQLYLGELSGSVVLPDDQWAQMRTNRSTVSAKVDGPITYVTVPNNPGGMAIGTANVTLIYRQGTLVNEDHVRVSVQVLCGPGSVPTPKSAQQAGDCKVVRFFDTAVEG